MTDRTDWKIDDYVAEICALGTDTVTPLYDLLQRFQKQILEDRCDGPSDRKDAERYRWLACMWPREITRLVHSHHTHGPTSSEIHGAIDASMAQTDATREPE